MYHYEKITYHLTALALLLGTALGTASCNDNEVETIVDKTAEAAYVTLTINTGDVAATRTLSFTDENGSDIENFIDPNNVHLYFLPDDAKAVKWNSNGTTNGTWSGESMWGTSVFLADVVPTTVTKTGTTTYKLTCKLNEDQSKELLTRTSCRVAVFANCGKLPFNKTHTIYNLECLPDGLYDYPNVFKLDPAPTAFTPSEKTPIPMFGLIQKSSFKLGQGYSQAADLGTVNMIRAMAKIELKTANSTDVLSDVTLSTCPAKGVYAPFAMWVETDFSEEHDGFFIGIPYEHSSTTTSLPTLSNLPFTKVDDTDYVIYIPETRQVGETVETKITSKKLSPKITFNFKTKDAAASTAYELLFKEYNEAGDPIDDTEFNILRNHIYRYTVSLAGGKFTLQYMVIPWTERTSPTITFE
jgi:hypothetical protein